MGYSPAFTITGADHVGFAVTSLDAALRSWVEGFGARLLRRGEMDGAFLEQVTGATGASLKTAMLEIADQQIELLEYTSAPAHDGSHMQPYHAGFAHLALRVTNLDSVLAHMAPYGWTPQGIPQVVEQGPNVGTRVMYIIGPDGETVELLQPPS